MRAVAGAAMPLITIRSYFSEAEKSWMYVASGPDGHSYNMLARYSEEAAMKDGEEYFLRTREIGPDGEWRLK